MAPAATASTASAQVTVIPPDPAQVTVPDELVFAGATGFLHIANGNGQYLWTSYATGATTRVSQLAGLAPEPAGGDSVWFTSNRQITELDLATMASQQLSVPTGDSFLWLDGPAMLVYAGATRSLAILTFAADGSHTTTPVTGVPSGAALFGQPGIGDDAAMVIDYLSSGARQYALLDLATGAAAPIPGTFDAPQIALSAGTVDMSTASGQVDVFSRSGLVTGTDTTPQIVTLPPGGPGRFAQAGQDVIAVPFAAPVSGPTSATAVSPQGGTTTALADAETGFAGGLAQAPDGALVVGGSGAGDWAVRMLSTDAGGNLVDTAVLPLTGPLTNAGLTISQGEVRHLEAEPVPGGQPRYLMFNHSLLPDTGFSQFSADPELYGGALNSPLACAPGASCVRTVDSNWYGTSYLGQPAPGRAHLDEQTAENGSTMSLSLPSSGGTLVDASPQFAIVDGTGPAAQYVIDVGQEQIVSTRSVHGAALWFSTVWRADGPGKLQAANLDTKVVSRPVSTGADCTAAEIQATLRWLYWSCGAAGPAGVYDMRRNTDIPVPAGSALLGDGFLVRHDQATGDLVLYDVHADAATGPVTLAAGVQSGPAQDDRNITWAVDKYSGDVAYVSADDSVHVIGTGVPATPPAVADPPAAWLQEGGILSFGAIGAWQEALFLSRPVTSWRLTIRRMSTGQALHTESGGPVKVGFYGSWDGRLRGGAKAYSGWYTWNLALTTAGSAAPVTARGSTLLVLCGQIPFRSYDCDGAAALLAVAPDTSAQWYQGTVAGTLRSGGYTENWPLCGDTGGNCVSAMVPFGDLNGDGYADLLVRYRSGVLRAYLGFGQAYFNSQTTRSVRIGSGWNAYNALVAPGSLTAGGRPVLLARDTSGRLWRYAATGHGTFAARRLIGGGWGGYTRLVGAGDLNGDGTGDLLAVDAHGTMWAYYGNGHGGFGARHRVSSGWGGYNAIIGVGDLNNRGHNDLVARDRRGSLWLFPGSGRGTFGTPVSLHLNLPRAALF